jgi:hypothetical protein
MLSLLMLYFDKRRANQLLVLLLVDLLNIGAVSGDSPKRILASLLIE